MKNSKKIFLILIFVFFLNFIISGFSFAQLEINYPPINGLTVTTQTMLPDYINYIFTLSLMIAGLVAFGALVYGGFKYLTSAGNPSKMSDAIDQVMAGILGLIIILSSYLILSTINPQLLILESPGLSVFQGIIIYKGPCQATKEPIGEEGEDFLKVSVSNSEIEPSFTAQSIFFIDSSEKLRVELYPNQNYGPKDSPSFNSDNSIFGVINNACYSLPSQTTFRSVKLIWKVPGVYLFTNINHGGKVFFLPATTDRLPDEIDDKTKSIKFIDSLKTEIIGKKDDSVSAAQLISCQKKEGDIEVKGDNLICVYYEKYGVILHEKRDKEGKATVFLERRYDLTGTQIGNDKASSATVFSPKKDVDENKTVTLCKDKECKNDIVFEFNFNIILTSGQSATLSTDTSWGLDEIRGIRDLTQYKWSNGDDIKDEWGIITKNYGGISSIRIEGLNYLVMLFDDADYEGDVEVISKNLSTIRLNDNVSSLMIIKTK